MKILKNKTILGIIAIVLAIVMCFILSPVYTKSLETKTKIVRITKTVAKGSQIADDDIRVVEVGKYNLPDDVITNKNEIIGMYAVTDLFKEDYLLPDKLSKSPLSNHDYLEGLDGMHGAMSITLQSFASGLSAKLLGGDIVSIIATDNNGGTTGIPMDLKYVKVLASTTGDGIDIDPSATNKDTENNKNIPVTVTLLVNEQQARSLANLEVTQRIHISLIYRGEEEAANKYLEAQAAILEQMNVIDEDDTVAEEEKEGGQSGEW